VKRLYESSLGPVVVELDSELAAIVISRFDANGRVVAETGDEWDWTDVSDLLGQRSDCRSKTRSR
jgi:hypothetical protein